MKEIEVTSCYLCKFRNYHYDYDFNEEVNVCNLGEFDINLEDKNSIDSICPLRKGSIVVKLKNNESKIQ